MTRQATLAHQHHGSGTPPPPWRSPTFLKLVLCKFRSAGTLKGAEVDGNASADVAGRFCGKSTKDHDQPALDDHYFGRSFPAD